MSFSPHVDYSLCILAAGGFMFKQWKEKYLVLTMEGKLLVCRDAESPPDQVVSLQHNCESIAEGREILDLPKLPPGGRRDCCFALILPQDKFLLLLADSPDDCKYDTPPLTDTFLKDWEYLNNDNINGEYENLTYFCQN